MHEVDELLQRLKTKAKDDATLQAEILSYLLTIRSEMASVQLLSEAIEAFRSAVLAKLAIQYIETLPLSYGMVLLHVLARTSKPSHSEIIRLLRERLGDKSFPSAFVGVRPYMGSEILEIGKQWLALNPSHANHALVQQSVEMDLPEFEFD